LTNFDFNNEDLGCTLIYSYSLGCGTTDSSPGIAIIESSSPSLVFDTNFLVDGSDYEICICASGEQEEECNSFIISYSLLPVVVPATNSAPYFVQAFEDQEV